MNMKPIQCGIERYPTGGEGVFHLSPAQMLLPALAGEYTGAIKLIYLDPPFRTGGDFYMRTDGKTAALPAYTDTLSSDAYLALMREILAACHTLLSPEGSLYLHVDYRMVAPLRLLLDELFGPGNFMNEIVWAYKSGGRSTRFFPRKHDTILFYRKTRKVYFNITAVGVRRGPERRNHMKRTVDSEGRVSYSIRSGGKVYVYHEDTPVYPSDVWTDIEHLHQRAPERLGYGTQKPEALLSRIVLASSAPNDIVADFFSGSGTTAAVAAKTGRRFLACDSSPYALYTIRKRLMASAHALTAPSAPLTLRYPAESPAFDVRAEIAPEVDACVCTVQGPDDLLYCALGAMYEGAFTPLVSSYSPRAPFTLHMPVCEAPVLHAVDGMGRQGFWAWQ